MTGGLIQKKQTIKVLNIIQFNILSWYLKRKIFRNHYKIKHSVKKTGGAIAHTQPPSSSVAPGGGVCLSEPINDK